MLVASASVEAPTPRSGTSGAAPTVAASASVNAPVLHLDQFVTVTGNGRTEVPTWARYIDVVLLGGGASGANGSLFGTGNGGKPGTYLTARWDRNAFPGVELGSLNIAIGGGGSGNNGAGGGTTIWIDAYDTTTYSGRPAPLTAVRARTRDATPKALGIRTSTASAQLVVAVMVLSRVRVGVVARRDSRARVDRRARRVACGSGSRYDTTKGSAAWPLAESFTPGSGSRL